MSETTFFHAGEAARDVRPVMPAIKRGFFGRCPKCGEGKLFGSFVKPVESCAVCGEELHHHRADDFPAYLNILVVGHVIVGGFTMTEVMTNWPGWVHLAIWIPLMLLMSIVLMQPLKGAVIGFQWANYMHGFGDEEDVLDTHPEAEG